MAKKKPTDHSNEPQSHQSSPMDVDIPSQKLQTLKNLNSLLLKETSERRNEVDSLVQANDALDSALNRSSMENKLLEDRLSKAAEYHVGLELEMGVVFVFVDTQMMEMGFCFDTLVGEKNEIECVKNERRAQVAFLEGKVSQLAFSLENERAQLSRLSRERDEIKKDLHDLVAEANGLRDTVIETEKRDRMLGEEIEKLRMEGEKLMEEKYEKERSIGELTTEGDLALSNLAESTRVIEKLNGEIDIIMREKNETEKQKNAQELKIIGLELEMKQLNETIKNLGKEAAMMRTNILDLETSLGQAMEKEKEMKMEVGALLKEKKQKEQSIEMLTQRKESIEKVLDTVQKDLEDKKHEIEETIRVKNEIEQVKVTRDSEIVELLKEVDHLSGVMGKLNESCRDLEEKNKQLLSEVSHYKNAVDELMLERDDFKKRFDEEKNEVKNLMSQVSGREDEIEHTAAELGQMRSEQEKLIERNKMMESRVDILMNEKDVLQRSLLEAQKDSDDLRTKVEFSCINSNQALAMLKNTAALLCESKYDKDSVEEVVFNGKKLGEEIQPYAEELDAIRDAFRSKNKIMEDMKQQLASLQNSVADAHKRKSLWTVISSATTIFAAALTAYVARGR